MSRKRENEDNFEEDVQQQLKDQRNQKNMIGFHRIYNSAMPCAACKLLRRRCSQECPFLPYFPPNEPQKFACVHKIFGASNVSKMLMEVPQNQRIDVANSLVYEANARIRDPVYGCMSVISDLQQQTHSLQAELAAVKAEIIRYRRHGNIVAAATVGGSAIETGLMINNGAATENFISTQAAATENFILTQAAPGRPNYAATAPNSSPSSVPDEKPERYWMS